MTIRYCDFCGDVIPEGEGDPVVIGDPECDIEARNDACDKCCSVLWKFRREKNLRGTSPVQSLASQQERKPDEDAQGGK